MALTGPRVLQGGGAIVAPATERTRYVPDKKLGYHGGATPQEVLCPLAVFVPASVTVEGLLATVPRPPSWWDGAPVDAPRLVPRTPIVTDGKGTPALFAIEPDGQTVPAEATAAGDAPGWLSGLLASPAWQAQRQAAGRGSLDDGEAARLLTLLDRAGGTLTADALVRATGTPAFRARTKLTALAQLVNVDGYPVLVVEPSGEARLDRAALRAQFELP